MSDDTWDEVKLRQMIADEIEESLQLDYKAAASLEKSDKKKAELAKDVSAMANSAGGTIIYGIAEFKERERRYLPEQIDPIDRTEFSKEWLEQVIGGIQPRITNIVIHPVALSTHQNHVAFVVEIPQSTTAHQAKDLRYYRRFNFESIAMHDYEIRDTLNRASTARVKLNFELYFYNYDPNIHMDAFGIPIMDISGWPPKEKKPRLPMGQAVDLNVIARNTGRFYIQHLQCFYYIHESFISPGGRSDLPRSQTDNSLVKLSGNNRYTGSSISSAVGKVILPGLETKVGGQTLNIDRIRGKMGDAEIFWEIHADNAPLQTGSQLIANIPRRFS